MYKPPFLFVFFAFLMTAYASYAFYKIWFKTQQTLKSTRERVHKHPRWYPRFPILLIGLTGLFLSSCYVSPTPSAVPTISEQSTRNQAIKIASTDDFHFTGATGPVSIVRAEKMTIQSALHYMQGQQLACNYDSDKESITNWVWVVMMEGVWPQNFPPVPTPTPTWVPWHSLVVVLDATTGEKVCMDAHK